MTKLILIRHGESIYNLEKRYTGQTDVPLTEKGILQAKITADYILKNYKIDEVYSSDLCRAVETAKPVAEPLGIEIKKDPRLREIYAGKWQGLYFSEVKELYKSDYDSYKSDRYTGRTTGGESLVEVYSRAAAAVNEIAERCCGKTVLISLHNGPLMALQALFMGTDLNHLTNMSNNSVTEVDYENGKYTVIKLGYDEHLGELVTSFKEKTAN
jgi:broad specificity phosphatase PhoE